MVLTGVMPKLVLSILSNKFILYASNVTCTLFFICCIMETGGSYGCTQLHDINISVFVVCVIFLIVLRVLCVSCFGQFLNTRYGFTSKKEYYILCSLNFEGHFAGFVELFFHVDKFGTFYLTLNRFR